MAFRQICAIKLRLPMRPAPSAQLGVGPQAVFQRGLLHACEYLSHLTCQVKPILPRRSFFFQCYLQSFAITPSSWTSFAAFQLPRNVITSTLQKHSLPAHRNHQLQLRSTNRQIDSPIVHRLLLSRVVLECFCRLLERQQSSNQCCSL